MIGRFRISNKPPSEIWNRIGRSPLTPDSLSRRRRGDAGDVRAVAGRARREAEGVLCCSVPQKLVQELVPFGDQIVRREVTRAEQGLLNPLVAQHLQRRRNALRVPREQLADKPTCRLTGSASARARKRQRGRDSAFGYRLGMSVTSPTAWIQSGEAYSCDGPIRCRTCGFILMRAGAKSKERQGCTPSLYIPPRNMCEMKGKPPRLRIFNTC
eukprot:1192329-Prorocentrum_minimum.AAC.7